MPILARNNSKPVELIPAGNYLARCYQMIEVGTITESVMGKNVTHPKVRIGWELPTELKVFSQERGEQPLVISQEYTLSMNEKSSLRKMLASWRGKEFTEDEAKSFDITKLLGVGCMLNIIHKPKKSDPTSFYQTIAGITGVPKGMKVPAAINKLFVLSYDDFDEALFDSLPDFIKNVMRTSEEFKELYNPNVKQFPQTADEVTEPFDDLPF
jgi:hypothetical protein